MALVGVFVDPLVGSSLLRGDLSIVTHRRLDVVGISRNETLGCRWWHLLASGRFDVSYTFWTASVVRRSLEMRGRERKVGIRLLVHGGWNGSVPIAMTGGGTVRVVGRWCRWIRPRLLRLHFRKVRSAAAPFAKLIRVRFMMCCLHHLQLRVMLLLLLLMVRWSTWVLWDWHERWTDWCLVSWRVHVGRGLLLVGRVVTLWVRREATVHAVLKMMMLSKVCVLFRWSKAQHCWWSKTVELWFVVYLVLSYVQTYNNIKPVKTKQSSLNLVAYEIHPNVKIKMQEWCYYVDDGYRKVTRKRLTTNSSFVLPLFYTVFAQTDNSVSSLFFMYLKMINAF